MQDVSIQMQKKKHLYFHGVPLVIVVGGNYRQTVGVQNNILCFLESFMHGQLRCHYGFHMLQEVQGYLGIPLYSA